MPGLLHLPALLLGFSICRCGPWSGYGLSWGFWLLLVGGPGPSSRGAAPPSSGLTYVSLLDSAGGAWRGHTAAGWGWVGRPALTCRNQMPLWPPRPQAGLPPPSSSCAAVAIAMRGGSRPVAAVTRRCPEAGQGGWGRLSGHDPSHSGACTRQAPVLVPLPPGLARAAVAQGGGGGWHGLGAGVGADTWQGVPHHRALLSASKHSSIWPRPGDQGLGPGRGRRWVSTLKSVWDGGEAEGTLVPLQKLSRGRESGRALGWARGPQEQPAQGPPHLLVPS